MTYKSLCEKILAVCLLLIQKSDFLRNAMHASNFLPNVFLQSTSKCRHIGGGDSQFTFFTQRENMRLSKEQSFIFYSVISSTTGSFIFTAGRRIYPNSALSKTCVCFFGFFCCIFFLDIPLSNQHN